MLFLLVYTYNSVLCDYIDYMMGQGPNFNSFGGNNLGGPSGGTGGGPPPGQNSITWFYEPGQRRQDIHDAFSDLLETAERRAQFALDNGTINQGQKKEFFIEEMKKVLQMCGREIAADLPGKKRLIDVENYQELNSMMKRHIAKIRRDG